MNMANASGALIAPRSGTLRFRVDTSAHSPCRDMRNHRSVAGVDRTVGTTTNKTTTDPMSSRRKVTMGQDCLQIVSQRPGVLSLGRKSLPAIREFSYSGV